MPSAADIQRRIYESEVRQRGRISESVNRRPVPSKQRPLFRREVIAPAFLISGGVFASFFCLVGAGLTVAGITDDRYSVEWFALALFSGAIASAVFTAVVLWQLPHYHELQTTYKLQQETIPGKGDDGRARIIEQSGPHTKAVTPKGWDINWRAELARRVYDAEGNWTGGDSPNRELFTGLVTNLTAQYQRGDVQAHLRRLGWTDDDGRWTGKARHDLRADLLRIP